MKTIFEKAKAMFFTLKQEKMRMVGKEKALKGRDEARIPSQSHVIFDVSLTPPFPENIEIFYVGMGCFWGAERRFWQQDGVYVTAVGYQGGYTPNPTYKEVCSGLTGHTESVMVGYDPEKVRFNKLIRLFLESHDPTQGMRQGNDRGTQYRSAFYYTNETQKEAALAAFKDYEKELVQKGYGHITTELKEAPPFYYAEDEHQQYLAQNPHGYCGLKGTGVEYTL